MIAEQVKQAGLFDPPPALEIPGLTPTERTVLDVLAEGPLQLDEIVRRTNLPSGQVISSMTMMVLKGAVAQQPGNVFARKTKK